MKEQTKLERFIEWLRNFPQLFCHHVLEFSTMDGIKETNWDRISGGSSCIKCGRSFHLIIPKNLVEKARLYEDYKE